MLRAGVHACVESRAHPSVHGVVCGWNAPQRELGGLARAVMISFRGDVLYPSPAVCGQVEPVHNKAHEGERGGCGLPVTSAFADVVAGRCATQSRVTVMEDVARRSRFQ